MPRPRLRSDTLSHAVHAQGRLAPPPARTSDNTRGTTVSPDLQGPSVSQLSMCSLAAMQPSVGTVPEHTVRTEPARPRLSTQRTLCIHTWVVDTNPFVGAEEFFWAWLHCRARHVGRHDLTTDLCRAATRQRYSDDVNKLSDLHRQAVHGRQGLELPGPHCVITPRGILTLRHGSESRSEPGRASSRVCTPLLMTANASPAGKARSTSQSQARGRGQSCRGRGRWPEHTSHTEPASARDNVA
jgi:hypothetical protein